MMKQLWIICGLYFFFLEVAFGQVGKPLLRLEVGKPRTQRSQIAFPPVRYLPKSKDPKGHVRLTRDVIVEDLAFSGLFTFISPTAFLEKKSAGVKLGEFKFSNWSAINAQFLIKTTGEVKGKNIFMNIYLYAVNTKKELFSKRYISVVGSVRRLAHTIAGDIFYKLTGIKAPFTSKVAFVSDRTGKKEIYVMDYDGHNVIQITRRRSVAMGPAWSPDGRTLLFSSITKNKKNVENHNLFSYGLSTGKIRLLSNRKGLNAGADYSPDGKKIALTMSFLRGNPDIFTMDPKTRKATRLTRAAGSDVDPSWSADGKKIAFISDRSGKSMVYVMDSNGKNQKRITYAGVYNATPSWSPTGKKIAFAGWKDKHFDIFIMNADGTKIERLTNKSGNNEDPHFASDGYFIIYSSNRLGKRNLYITNIDNTVHRRITHRSGNNESPKWGPPL